MEVGQIVITISAFLIAFSILVMIYNLFHSAEVGRVAGANPWRSRSPEWQISFADSRTELCQIRCVWWASPTITVWPVRRYVAGQCR